MSLIDKNLPYYHIIDLPDGSTTPGRVDRRKEGEYLGLKGKQCLAGKRVLDVGALDGVLSFWAEKSGASDVLVIDVEDIEHYDWGYSGPPSKMRGKGAIKNKVFEHLKQVLDSKVQREGKTVYDLSPEIDGYFDLIFFYGVLYHLRHPLLAFDRLREVCQGAIAVETHVCNVDPQLPASLFYLDDVLKNAITNWHGPTEACVVHWMKNAGFERVFVEKKQRIKGRQRFIGLISEKVDFCFSSFPSLDNFRECDTNYFKASRKAIKHYLSLGSFDQNPWFQDI